MGSQQLLLIILGVIVVGVAVATGVTMFQDYAGVEKGNDATSAISMSVTVFADSTFVSVVN